VAARRRRWKAWRGYVDPERLVFLDEAGASTNMVRRHGWAPIGARLVDAAPHGHWKTTTLVAALRASGIVAPDLRDGPMTAAAFCAYVRETLAPTLMPGDVVIMDNLPAHKRPAVREAIVQAGASLLHLPPYSPDLNPIEQAFAKLKATLRKAAARTRDELWKTIRGALADYTPDECRNYIANARYGRA
jgi:transposase